MNRNGYILTFLFLLAIVAVSISLGCAAQAAPPVTTGEVALFVDALRGSDDNSGESAEKPLKSLWAAQKMMDRAPADKRVILNLARGSVWRENLDFPTGAEYHRFVSSRGGRPLLTIRPYGKGDKPTISGFDPMPNGEFKPYDAAKYPSVWWQRRTPPVSHQQSYAVVLGMLVNGERPLRMVSLEKHENTFIQAESDKAAIARVNDNVGTFYARDNKDGTWDYFVNSGSDPTKDDLSYEYKVRSSIFPARPWNRWEDIRFIGLNGRNGIQAGGSEYWMSMKGVEVLYGCTHNMLVIGYRLEGVLSVGYFGSTGFHAHNPRAAQTVYGTLYDKCTVRNSGIAFYDHAWPDRPWVYLRDCVTENVRNVMNHSAKDSRQAFVIGHRHNLNAREEKKPDAFSPTTSWLGILTDKGYVEDSLLRVWGNGFGHGVWHTAAGPYARFRNSVFHATLSAPAEQRAPFSFYNRPDVDMEYEYCTLILDFEGEEITPRRAVLAGASGNSSGRIKLKNSVIAVLGAPNMKVSAAGTGTAVRFGSLPMEVILENCVLTYMEGLPEGAGEEAKGYIFAAADDIFAGDVSKGDYSLRDGGPAAKADAGYRSGRKPVYRAIADKLAAELPK